MSTFNGLYLTALFRIFIEYIVTTGDILGKQTERKKPDILTSWRGVTTTAELKTKTREEVVERHDCLCQPAGHQYEDDSIYQFCHMICFFCMIKI